MYSYKGVDSNFEYKVGTVEAENKSEALKLIKEQEDILIVVSLSKVPKIKVANDLNSFIQRKIVEFENRMKSKSKKKREKKEARKSKKKTNGIETSKKKEEKKSLAERSPILKAFKAVSSKITSNKKFKDVDEEIQREIQVIFKDDIAELMESSELTENKVSYTEHIPKNEKEGLEINWELLDTRDEDPEIKNNNKLKVKEKEILMFTRRLQIMISSGVSLMNSLRLLSETSSKDMSQVLKGVLEDINMGNSLSKAISKYPKIFNAFYVALVSIGETTGELDSCLLDIIKMKEQEQKIIKKVRIASIYPAIVGLVLTVMMIGVSFFFLPRFEEMYAEQNLNIPMFTQIVFTIAGFIPQIVIIAVALFIVVAFLRKRVPTVNRIYIGIRDKLLLTTPILKSITSSLYMYYFSSAVSLMLKNGIRLSDTLSLAGRSINNIYVRSEIENIGQLMIHGLSFSEAMAKQENFDDVLINITHTGEESGQMVFALTKVSEYYDTEVNNKIDSLMEVIPSASIILIGVIAAPIIIAAYLPILEISSGSVLDL